MGFELTPGRQPTINIRKGFHSFQGWFWGLTEIDLLHDDAQNITKQ